MTQFVIWKCLTTEKKIKVYFNCYMHICTSFHERVKRFLENNLAIIQVFQVFQVFSRFTVKIDTFLKSKTIFNSSELSRSLCLSIPALHPTWPQWDGWLPIVHGLESKIYDRDLWIFQLCFQFKMELFAIVIGCETSPWYIVIYWMTLLLKVKRPYNLVCWSVGWSVIIF